MSEKKPCKPPVPARPKNLVVLNSKHLPKPPEKFLCENVSTVMKDLSLGEKDEESQRKRKMKNLCQRFENSDSEEDTYGYLEPVSLSSGASVGQLQHKKFGYEEGSKFGDGFRRNVNRNGSEEVEESKPPVPQSQWQRPLPLPPVETKSVVATMPWYKNVDRKKGEEILRNGVDGYFLVRPSSNADTYLTLTLWHNSRVYNIPIRKRKDGKFALGTPKTHEQCFDSVEYLVKNYQSEKLVLFSNGVQTGKTLLTTYPPLGRSQTLTNALIAILAGLKAFCLLEKESNSFLVLLKI